MSSHERDHESATRDSSSTVKRLDSMQRSAAMRETFIDLICEGIDATIRVAAIILFMSSFLRYSGEDLASGAYISVQWEQIPVGIACAIAYWLVGACVKLTDDILDDEDHEAFIRIMNNTDIVSPWARHGLLIALVTVASASSLIAAINPLAAVMMAGEVLGCLLAGKIDSIYHWVVLVAIVAAGVL